MTTSGGFSLGALLLDDLGHPDVEVHWRSVLNTITSSALHRV